MKLADLKGERAIEVIADLITPIANIANDAEMLGLFNNKRLEGESIHDAGFRLFKEKIPLMLKTHKKDVLDIICAVNGSVPEDLSLLDIFSGTAELLKDQDFVSLFLSAVKPRDRKSVTEFSVDAEHSEPES